MKKFLFFIFIFSFISKYSHSQNPQWIVYNTSNSGIQTNDLKYIEIDSNNIKWISCVGGLIKFDGNSWFQYNSSNSPILNDRLVLHIEKDKYNGLWINVNAQGLMYLKNGNFTIYNSSNSGMPSNSPYSLSIESDTIKWMGMVGNKFVRFDGNIWRIYDSTNSGFKDDVVNAIDVSGHTKWFGTAFHGLGKFNDTTWTYYNPGNSGLQDLAVISIYIINPDRVWLGTRFKGAYKFNPSSNQWINYNTNNSPLHENGIVRIFEDRNYGSVFMSQSFNELAILNDSNWAFYGPPIPIGTTVAGFRQDKYHNIWITSTNGLFVYNPNGIVNIQDQNSVVKDFELFQNCPNPFNPSTKIAYNLQKSSVIELKIFDINGKLIKIVDTGFKYAGSYEATFNSEGLASGIYFYTLSTGNFRETKRMLLLK